MSLFKLLPCPFCGHEPEISNLIDSLHPTGGFIHYDADSDIHYFTHESDGATGEVWHMGCLTDEGGCGAEVSGEGKQGVIDAWNRRPAVEVDNTIDGWQTIETAPKDGTPILACMPYQEGFSLWPARHPITVYWGNYHPNSKGKEAWRDGNGVKRPHLTHCRPLMTTPMESS